MASEHKANRRKSFVIMSSISVVVFLSLVFILTPFNQVAYAGAPPPQVTGLTVVQNMSTFPELDWDDVVGADSYEIFRGNVKFYEHLNSGNSNATIDGGTQGRFTKASGGSQDQREMTPLMPAIDVNVTDITMKLRSHPSGFGGGSISFRFFTDGPVMPTDRGGFGGTGTINANCASTMLNQQGDALNYNSLDAIVNNGWVNWNLTYNNADCELTAGDFVYFGMGSMNLLNAPGILYETFENGTGDGTSADQQGDKGVYTIPWGLVEQNSFQTPPAFWEIPIPCSPTCFTDPRANGVNFVMDVNITQKYVPELIGTSTTSDFIDITVFDGQGDWDYFVRAVNESGTSDNSTSVDFGLIRTIMQLNHTTYIDKSTPSYNLAPAPAAIMQQGLTAEADGTDIRLKWDVVKTEHPSDPLTGIIIQRANETAQIFETIVTVDDKDVSYTDSGLEPNTKYFYRAKAASALSTGAFPNIDFFTSGPTATTGEGSQSTSDTFSPEKDSFLRQGTPNRNEGINEIMQLRANGNNRALVEFNQTDIDNAVGTSTLDNATLRLYIEENFNGWGSSGRTIDAHRITETWAEGNAANLGGNIPGTGDGVTWKCAVDTDISDQNKDCTTEWGGGNFDGTATDSLTITNGLEGVYVEFDVTADVQDFLDGTTTNHGWIIKKTLEGQAGRLQFTSSDGVANHPELVIFFS